MVFSVIEHTHQSKHSTGIVVSLQSEDILLGVCLQVNVTNRSVAGLHSQLK